MLTKFVKCYLFSIFIISLFSFSPIYGQEDNFGSPTLIEGESGEEIMAREQFIYMRRAGGPGMVIPVDAYTNALVQKSLLPEDRLLPNSPTSTVSWVSVNPIGMFYSRTNNNYVSGRTNSIAFHPSNPNIIYVGAAQGGVWKTTNGGINWIAVTDGLSSLSCGDVVIDPSNPNTLYLGTGEQNYSGDSHYGDGIFKSTDAGTTWSKIATTAVGTYFSKLAIDPSNTSTVYAAGNQGIYKSTNSGVNWTSTSSITYTNCIIIDPTNTQTLYTSSGTSYSSGTVRKSTNGGLVWLMTTNGLPSGTGRIQLAMATGNPNILYASISNTSGSLVGLYRTTDAANTWTLQASTPNYLGSQGWYDNVVTVMPSSPNNVLVGGIDIYSSNDAGVTLNRKTNWAATTSSNFSHADIHNLSYNGGLLYCCSDGGVYKSTDDGTSWIDLNHDLSTLQYQSADYDPTTLLKLYGGCQDNDKETTTDGGNNWNQRTTGDGGYTIVDPVNTNYIYCQYVSGSLERSANYGVSFTEIRPSGSTGGLFYNPFEMAPGDHNTIVFGRADVWKTTSAQTATQSSGWTQIAATTDIGGSVSAIGISSIDINIIYIGTSNGKIIVTTNNGGKWTAQGGFPYVSDFVVDASNDAVCYASFAGTAYQHVAKTTNYGVNWVNITNDLPNIAANSISLRNNAPRMIFAGTDIGVFSSTNEGSNWVSFNTGFPSVQIYDMKYKDNVGILLVATHGRGCWTFNVNQAVGIAGNNNDIPNEYRLMQNYPNPFNPSTSISYELPSGGLVTLKIYDILGNQVIELVNGHQNAGVHRVEWDASGYPSGAYFYKITVNNTNSGAGNFFDTKKMVLIK
jgi:photosystem II stability/assembly factor-like uncharacterized protein